MISRFAKEHTKSTKCSFRRKSPPYGARARSRSSLQHSAFSIQSLNSNHRTPSRLARPVSAHLARPSARSDAPLPAPAPRPPPPPLPLPRSLPKSARHPRAAAARATHACAARGTRRAARGAHASLRLTLRPSSAAPAAEARFLPAPMAALSGTITAVRSSRYPRRGPPGRMLRSSAAGMHCLRAASRTTSSMSDGGHVVARLPLLPPLLALALSRLALLRWAAVLRLAVRDPHHLRRHLVVAHVLPHLDVSG